jgi:hypothetical protein
MQYIKPATKLSTDEPTPLPTKTMIVAEVQRCAGKTSASPAAQWSG